MQREALARAVIDARKRAGLTQAQLAERAGLSRSAIMRLESGEASLSADPGFPLCRGLHIKPSELWAAVESDPAAAKTLEPRD